ncbi:MAG: SIS domain-containing protein [Erysipelotrichaceae bacterium]|nr:SIS domain-containing protein [Erysipelotrichaceae bacterium]
MSSVTSTFDRSNLPEDAMLSYIRETPSVLQKILDERKEYSREFVEQFVREKYKRVILIGSGTSYHGGLSVRSLMEKVLKVTVDANYPLLFMNFTSVFDQKTLAIGISQSGESKSTLQGLEYARKHGCDTVSLSEKGSDSIIAGYADLNLRFNSGSIELSGPKTKGYQATMLDLIILSLESALAMGTISEDCYNGYIERIQKTIDNLSAIIENSVKWYYANRDELMESKRIIVVGYGNNYGNVLEGRLKTEEAVRFGIEGYEMEEFMHGIYHSIDESVQIVYLAQQSEAFKSRAVRLRDFMHEWTPHEYLIGNFPDGNVQNLSGFVDDEAFCIFEYIIPLQILAFHLSRDKGINCNIPKIQNFHYRMGSK